jgi:hypothetical protein
MKTLWHRLVSRYKRIKAEVAQVEREIAMEQKPLIPAAPLFPKKPYKISTVTLFCAFVLSAAIAVWISFRELIVPLFR